MVNIMFITNLTVRMKTLRIQKGAIHNKRIAYIIIFGWKGRKFSSWFLYIVGVMSPICPLPPPPGPPPKKKKHYATG